MAIGKFLSLDEAQKLGKIDKFAKQFKDDPPNAGFQAAFDHIIKHCRADGRTSSQPGSA